MIPSPLSPSIALAAYAEPFVTGRRVVVFGDATSGLAEYLVDRGARLVHVYDHEPARIAEASARSTLRSISFAPLGQGGIAVRDAVFDFGLIENLALARDKEELLSILVRSLSPRGGALVATPNPDARLKLLPDKNSGGYGAPLGYYELYDRVAEHFREVRMLGQLPFVGYAVADFSPEHEPNISVDTSLIPGGAEEPEWFLALASQEPLDSDAFTIVELPFSQALRPGQDPALEPALSRARAEEQVLLGRIAELEAEASELKAAKKLVTDQRSLALEAELKQRVGELKEQIGKRDAWLAQLEARAATADLRADQAEAELEKRKSQAANESAREASVELSRERDQLLLERAELKERGAAEQRRVEELVAQAELARSEVAKLEAQLEDRGSTIQRLERELKETERVATELVRELDAARADHSKTEATTTAETELVELRIKLDNLAFANAEREANLLAADWTICELETKLASLAPIAETSLEATVSDTAEAPALTQDGESSSSAALPR